MFLLLFLVLLVQFFTYWIFKPLTFVFDYFFEIRLLPIFLLVALILLFSAKNIENN